VDFFLLTEITRDNLRLMWIIIFYYPPCWISADYYRSRCDSLSHIKGVIHGIYPVRDTTKPQSGRWHGARNTSTEDLSGQSYMLLYRRLLSDRKRADFQPLRFFRRVRKIARSGDWLRNVCLCVGPHETSRFLLNRFSWNLTFGFSSKICREFNFH
jgi:hypothetical protein